MSFLRIRHRGSIDAVSILIYSLPLSFLRRSNLEFDDHLLSALCNHPRRIRREDCHQPIPSPLPQSPQFEAKRDKGSAYMAGYKQVTTGKRQAREYVIICAQ